MAKKKTATAVTEYQALVGLANDKTGKRFNAGDTITSADFSAKQIQAFCDIGAIAEVS